MPSQSQAHNANRNEIPLVNHTAPEKRSSLQYQAPRLSNEKVSSIGERKPLKPGKAIEKNDPDQHAARAEKIIIGNSVPVTPLGNQHKPWPSRKVTQGDDVVKYMSSVPSYLQRLEKGDSVQEKALNFGVLDWGRLEKWTYLQKQEANKKGVDSPSTTNSSSLASFSTFGSSSQYTRSNDSPFAQKKQSPKLAAYHNSSVENRQTEIDEQNSVHIKSNPDLKTSRSGPSEKGKSRYSNAKGISIGRPQLPDDGSSSSASKVDDIPNFAHNKVKSQIGSSRRAEKFLKSEQQSFPGNLFFAEDCLQDQCSVVEGILNHLQQSEHARRISYDSAAVNNGWSAEVSRKSFSGNFPPSYYKSANQPPCIPYSYPLPSTSQSDEPSVSSTLLSENEVLCATVQGKKLGLSSENLSEKSVFSRDNKASQNEEKLAPAPRRELSPHRLLSAALSRIRSSTLREGSSGQQMKQTMIPDNSRANATSISRSRRNVSPSRLLSAGLNRIKNSSLGVRSSGKEMKQTFCSDNSQEENAASSSRSRRSPLRRILDPLLKSKNQIHFSGPANSLTSHHAQEVRTGDKSADEPCKSSDANIKIPEAGCSVRAGKQVISTRRALLKLAWKNGLPLFVFSANDNNTLAATIRIQKNDFNCMYTMFTAHELKKNGGILTSQGNKSKNHDLAYNVVGQIWVSSSKSTSVGSKFVLFGNELAPTADGCVNSPYSELAAIIIQVPNESPKNSDGLQSNNSRNSSERNSAENICSRENLHIEKKNGNSCQASIIAILPSGVHGISSTGEPSPLVERWKSGGSCDCGGWDEGCPLTVLTNKIQAGRHSSSSKACSADGAHQIELFPQGEDRDNKHTFRMTAFREGVYTVQFGTSIALVQAFAMCIAILHGRKPHTLLELHYSMKDQSIQECALTDQCTSINSEKNQSRAPASYVPDRPPLSPVSRA